MAFLDVLTEIVSILCLRHMSAFYNLFLCAFLFNSVFMVLVGLNVFLGELHLGIQ